MKTIWRNTDCQGVLSTKRSFLRAAPRPVQPRRGRSDYRSGTDVAPNAAEIETLTSRLQACKWGNAKG
jgi:hypothetical protein